MELQWNFKHSTYDNKKVKVQATINVAMKQRKDMLLQQLQQKMYEVKELKKEIKLIDSYVNNQIL